jgi:hypothetical protein
MLQRRCAAEVHFATPTSARRKGLARCAALHPYGCAMKIKAGPGGVEQLTVSGNHDG